MELTLKKMTNKISVFDGEDEITSFNTDSVDFVLTWLKFKLTKWLLDFDLTAFLSQKDKKCLLIK